MTDRSVTLTASSSSSGHAATTTNGSAPTHHSDDSLRSPSHSRHSSSASSSLRRSLGLPPSFSPPPPPPCAPPPPLAAATTHSESVVDSTERPNAPPPCSASAALPWWLSLDRRIASTRSSADILGEDPEEVQDPTTPNDSLLGDVEGRPSDHQLLEKLVTDAAIPRAPSGAMRWMALSLCCLLLFGNFYAYDNPSAISVQMHDHLGVPYAQFAVYLNLFYSVYSLPNVFLTLISGWLMDRFGIHRVLLVLGAFVCTGQLLFALGLAHKSLNLMLLGRVLFGLGGESVGVAQASITTSWFRNKELAFALGINLCVARLGSVVNAMLSPRIALTWGVVYAAWAGVVACCASFVAGCLLAGVVGMPPDAVVAVAAPVVQPALAGDDEDLVGAVRRYFEAHEQHDATECDPRPHTPRGKPALDDCQPLLLGATPDGNVTPPALDGTTAGASSASASSGQSILQGYGTLPRRKPTTLVARQLTSPGPHDALLAVSHHSPADLLLPMPPPPARRPTTATSVFDNDRRSTLGAGGGADDDDAGPTSLLGTMRHLPLSFYLVCLVCILLYPTVISFTAIASEFLQAKWYPGDPASAGIVMSTPDSLSAILVPVLGLLIDKFGRRCTSMALCALLMAGSHLLLALVDPALWSPLWGMVPLGMAYSLYGTAMWPGIACVVRDARWVATAYGAATAALNASLAVTPVAVAWAVVRATPEEGPAGGWQRFVPVEFMFVGMALTGFGVSCVLYAVDRREGGYLEVPEVGQVQMVAVAGDDTADASVAIVLPPPPMDELGASRSSSGRGLVRRRPTGLGILHHSRTASAGSSDGAPGPQRPAQLVHSPLVTPMFFHPMIRSASVNSLIAATTLMPASPASARLHPLSRSASISVVSPSTAVSSLYPTATSAHASPVVRGAAPSRAATDAAPTAGRLAAHGGYRRIRGPPSSCSSMGGGSGLASPAAPVLSAILEQQHVPPPRRVQSYVHVRDVFEKAHEAGRDGAARCSPPM